MTYTSTFTRAHSNVVFCDVDGVLCEWSRAFSTIVHEKFGTPIMSTPDVPNWAWSGVFEKKHFDYGWQVVRRTADWWERLDPLAAPETLSRIAMLHREVPIIFVTARTSSAGKTVQQQTIRWLEQMGVKCPLVITRDSAPATGIADKTGLIEAFQPRAIIDDQPKTAREFAEAGIPAFVPPWPYTEVIEGVDNVVRVPLEEALDMIEERCFVH